MSGFIKYLPALLNQSFYPNPLSSTGDKARNILVVLIWIKNVYFKLGKWELRLEDTAKANKVNFTAFSHNYKLFMKTLNMSTNN